MLRILIIKNRFAYAMLQTIAFCGLETMKTPIKY